MEILLIKGNPKNAELIQKVLKKSEIKVDFSVGKQASLEAALNPRYQMLIIDLEDPAQEGIELISDLRKNGVTIPYLILTPPSMIEEIAPLLEEGRSDFVMKPLTVVEFKARLQNLRIKNLEKFEASQIQSAELILDLKTRQAIREAQKITLQNNEFELLEFLMRNSGRVITKAQILQKIWDYNFDPQTNVVDVLVWRLREKIDKHFSTKLIRTVRGVGYIFQTV